MEICPTTEKRYNDFMKLPPRAQLLFFNMLDKTRGRDYRYFLWAFDTSGCKSPIEQMLLFATNVTNQTYSKTRQIHLEPQHKIICDERIYYADLFFDSSKMSVKHKNEIQLIIECDGHDYHHSSKEQVAKDYDRENRLKLAGYDILRFSGSQIYENPWSCSKNIITYIEDRIGIKEGAPDG